MLKKLLKGVNELREQTEKVYKNYREISECSLSELEKDDNLKKMKKVIEDNEKVKNKKEYNFSYKDMEGKEHFTSADKKKYELENRPLPLYIYNSDKVFNDKDKIIVVTESEEICDKLEKVFSKDSMFTFTTILGGVDRMDIYNPMLYGYFKNRIVILMGREEKFEHFQQVLDEFTSYIIEQYIFLQ